MNEFDGVLESIASRAQKSQNEYLAEDGTYRCRICNAKTRCVIKLSDREMEVHCACKCDEQEAARKKEQERKEAIDRKKRDCFPNKAMREWSFENDDRANPKLSDAMQRYANNFADFLKDSKGLLIYGSVGTGKSFYAACIANRIIENGYSAYMTNFSSLVNTLQSSNIDKNEFIAGLNRYELLIIDDLGAERSSEFMTENVFNVIDKRCSSGLPMIITSNLGGDDFKNPDDIRLDRIYDRILENCFPVEMKSQSRRRAEARKSYADIKTKLGL